MINQNKKASIVLIFVLLFFCLLCLLLAVMKLIELNEKVNNSNNEVVATTAESNTTEKTIITVLREHESEYISQENNTIYVTFGKDLYTEDGKSNKTFFVSLAKDLEQFFEKESFYLIDEYKKINIFVKYIEDEDTYELIFNEVEDFYENTDGDSYIEVENTSIVDPSKLFVSNDFLERLILNNMYFSSIENYLTDEDELENGYKVYQNERLELKLAPNKTVFNIIFFDDYEGSILSDVTANMSLSQILELHSDNSFGSLKDEYLGYRNGDLYYFFYKDEVSVYGYSYKENTEFEKLLTAYIEDKDLDKFVKGLKSKIKVYDEFEYDSDIKKAHITFPTRGIEIDIKDNDPKGIILYSNYYFTETTKELVKNGQITLNSKEDLVHKYEVERRESK